MTTLKVSPTRTIMAAIKGKMEKQNAKGPYLSVQVLRDGMQYPETFNCWDPKQLEHVGLNQSVVLILHCDGVKAGKLDDGQVGSYWWGIAGVASPDKEAPPPAQPDPGPPAPAAAQQLKGPPSTGDAIQERIKLGMAINGAISLAAQGTINLMPDEIRLWRDILLTAVIDPPYDTPCLDHLSRYDRTSKSGARYHTVSLDATETEDGEPWEGYCVEGQGLVAKEV